MSRAPLLLLLLLGLGAFAMGTESSEPVQVLVQTWPPGALIYRDVSSPEQVGSYLGRSGEPFWIDLRRVQRSSTLRLRLSLRGYADQVVEIPSGALGPETVYPARGSLRLQPVSWQGWLGQNAWLLLGLTLLLGGGWIELRRRLRQSARRLSHQTELERWRRAGDPMNLVLVGNWRLLEKLGEGAQGTVYRALPEADLAGGRPVAVKLFRPGCEEHGRRAARICARLLHPSLVPVLDYGTHQGRFFLVSELVEGESLPALELPEAGRALLQVMEAVAYLHDQGLVHGDLRPGNILLDARRGARLIDLGGTSGDPAYMAPEVLESGRVVRASDQYALGVIGWEQLMGEHPFRADDLVSMVRRRYAPLPVVAGKIGELSRVLARMLAVSPADRYADLRDASAALRAALERSS